MRKKKDVMFTINLNKESAVVLLRCLSYGDAAISSQEVKNGIGAIINENVKLIRKQVCDKLSKMILEETKEKNQ